MEYDDTHELRTREPTYVKVKDLQPGTGIRVKRVAGDGILREVVLEVDHVERPSYAEHVYFIYWTTSGFAAGLGDMEYEVES